ncbi:hypothetical protein Q4R79_18800 [Morganella morganii]|uniref:hypothetical protein n=1 Tax=Morganella morganii TaxID=582 RepID=UPI0031A2D394|nr:hypothetical protein [Morganella morganii]
MAEFNRALQLDLVKCAVDSYPAPIDTTNLPSTINNADTETLAKNIMYLNEEDLLIGGAEYVIGGIHVSLNNARATKNAINLLSEDGSISASLKVVTVKFHDDTIAALREFITLNVPDPEERKGYLQRLKELPADATKHIVLQLLGKGLNQIPDAIQWLQTVLRS